MQHTDGLIVDIVTLTSASECLLIQCHMLATYIYQVSVLYDISLEVTVLVGFTTF